MAKPAIYIVAPDSNFLKVAERYLNSEFGDRFCVISASGNKALGELKQLKQHQPVALFMVEQQMLEMTGIEICEQAIALFPKSKTDLTYRRRD